MSIKLMTASFILFLTFEMCFPVEKTVCALLRSVLDWLLVNFIKKNLILYLILAVLMIH